ncbi:zinc finger protein pita-like [Onthophagus taurus]|uniref:zinc finger protein pita-like n=1 Tax=Onthophagus taurus TaxID=166361 RepID=UPI0039BEAE45
MASEDRAGNLRSMAICRFCLDDKAPLVNIYEHDGKSVPLPLQIMACVALEVFKNDGMPQLICDKCKTHTQQAYNFKATCKKSDDALKSYLATGDLRNLQKISLKDLKLQVVAKKRQISQEPSTSSESTFLAQKRPKPEIVSPIKPNNQSQIEEETSQSPPIEFEVTSLCCDGSPRSDTNLQQEDEDDEGEEEGDDEDNINPILKVTQVKTDVFPCDQCERSFPLKQLLELHMRNHERERGYKCSICNRKFFTKNDLGKHIQTHSNNKPFECVVCNKSFSREALLQRHERTHVDVPKYLCTTCDRTFLTRDDLDCHVVKHNKKRPYTCGICNKSFVFKQGLERHEVTHAEEKPHKCNYCEASFTSPIKLMRHITTHAGLRPYPCKVCGRTFLLSHHLTRHMRSHYSSRNDNQPVGQHKCDLCSMSFKRKDSLINHSTIHSMVNLKCVICNTSFENAKQVMNHITTHLSGLPYHCDKCDYSFETQDQLEEHEIKHAEMEYEEQIEQEVSQEEANKIARGDDEDEEEDDDVVEFTITNTEDAEIVRRPQRTNKIKNYAQFLKDELGSDVEDEIIKEGNDEEDDEEEIGEEMEEENLDEKTQKMNQKNQKHDIKPIVRSEGTKVYTRKSSTLIEKPKNTQEDSSQNSENSQNSQKNSSQESTESNQMTIENLGLTVQDLQSLPNKQYVDMKIGDKTLRVQKLMMTKAEIEAMAKQGKIEMKGDTILLRKTVQKPMPLRHTMETIIDQNPKPTVHKPVVKKTYVKKVHSVPKIVKDESVGGNEGDNGSQGGEEVIGD